MYAVQYINGHPHKIIANYLLALNNPIQQKYVVLIAVIQCHSAKFQMLTSVFFFPSRKACLCCSHISTLR